MDKSLQCPPLSEFTPEKARQMLKFWKEESPMSRSDVLKRLNDDDIEELLDLVMPLLPDGADMRQSGDTKESKIDFSIKQIQSIVENAIGSKDADYQHSVTELLLWLYEKNIGCTTRL